MTQESRTKYCTVHIINLTSAHWQEADLLALVQQHQKRVTELEALLKKSEQAKQAVSKELEELRARSAQEVCILRILQ